MKKHTLLPAAEIHTLALDANAQDLQLECQSYFGQLPIVEMQQVHGVAFHELTELPADHLTLPQVDGVITSLSGVVLAVRTADCLPILMYHPSGVIGAVHAGRRGTQQGILQKILTHLRQQKQITNDLQLWFGPAICESCYQIDQVTDLHYSLISQNIQQLQTVFPEGSYTLSIDTTCTQEHVDWHSYRRNGQQSGRNYSLITKK